MSHKSGRSEINPFGRARTGLGASTEISGFHSYVTSPHPSPRLWSSGRASGPQHRHKQCRALPDPFPRFSSCSSIHYRNDQNMFSLPLVASECRDSWTRNSSLWNRSCTQSYADCSCAGVDQKNPPAAANLSESILSIAVSLCDRTWRLHESIGHLGFGCIQGHPRCERPLSPRPPLCGQYVAIHARGLAGLPRLSSTLLGVLGLSFADACASFSFWKSPSPCEVASNPLVCPTSFLQSRLSQPQSARRTQTLESFSSA